MSDTRHSGSWSGSQDIIGELGGIVLRKVFQGIASDNGRRSLISSRRIEYRLYISNIVHFSHLEYGAPLRMMLTWPLEARQYTEVTTKIAI